MCGQAGSLLTGAAASGGNAATSGLFGTAGEFALGNTLSTVGTVASIAGQRESSSAQSDALKAEADLIKRQGEFDVAQREDEAKKLKSRQIISAAKSGVKRTGSVLEVMSEASQIAEEEALAIDYAASQNAQSKLFEAKQVDKSSNISSLTTALGSFGSRF